MEPLDNQQAWSEMAHALHRIDGSEGTDCGDGVCENEHENYARELVEELGNAGVLLFR